MLGARKPGPCAGGTCGPSFPVSGLSGLYMRRGGSARWPQRAGVGSSAPQYLQLDCGGHRHSEGLRPPLSVHQLRSAGESDLEGK